MPIIINFELNARMSCINAAGQIIYYKGNSRFAVEKLHRRDIISFDGKTMTYADKTSDETFFSLIGCEAKLQVGRRILNLIPIPEYELFGGVPSCKIQLSMAGDSIYGPLVCHTFMVRGMYYIGQNFYYKMVEHICGWLVSINDKKFIIDGKKQEVQCEVCDEKPMKYTCIGIEKVEITKKGLIVMYALGQIEYIPMRYNFSDVASIKNIELSGNKIFPLRVTYKDGTTCLKRIISSSSIQPHVVCQDDKFVTYPEFNDGKLTTIHGTTIEKSEADYVTYYLPESDIIREKDDK